VTRRPAAGPVSAAAALAAAVAPDAPAAEALGVPAVAASDARAGAPAGIARAVDVDGALVEAHERLTRAGLLRGAALAGGTVLAGGLARPAAALAASRRDRAILNYALTLEYLQSSFYTEAERVGAVDGRTAEAARVLGAVERAHVQAFRALLGSAAVKRPAFDFRGTTESTRAFLRTAVAFEDLAVAAYKGQAGRIEGDDVLRAAVSIASVEARHAAWMRNLFGVRPAGAAFDEPRSRSEIERVVRSTRFVVQRPRTTRKRRSPRFTG
jgi:rubrerythrin